MKYVKKDSKEAQKLKLETRPSIHITGSVKGMKKQGYWGKNDVIVRSGNYYYNISRTSFG